MRCFLVTGPESSGNRLLAAILVRAGCIGQASTVSQYDEELPRDQDPAVVIRSVPHGLEMPDLEGIARKLRRRGYRVTVLVTCRHPVAVVSSQVEHGHAKDSATAHRQIREAYKWIFGAALGRIHCHLVPYESLVLDPVGAVESLLKLLDLPVVTEGELEIDGLTEEGIRNENLKHFAMAAA